MTGRHPARPTRPKALWMSHHFKMAQHTFVYLNKTLLLPVNCLISGPSPPPLVLNDIRPSFCLSSEFSCLCEFPQEQVLKLDVLLSICCMSSELFNQPEELKGKRERFSPPSGELVPDSGPLHLLGPPPIVLPWASPCLSATRLTRMAFSQ